MIHYITTGSGPIQLVFLHGLFGQGKNFSRIAAALADVATCHLPDLPNHGASSWTVGFSLDGQAEHIARWLQKSFASPVALVGHSLGGKLAMRLALSHPEMVDRLLVADISPAPSDGPSSFAPLVGAMHSLDLEHLASRTEASRRLSTAIPDPQVRGFCCRTSGGSAGTGLGWPIWTCLVTPWEPLVAGHTQMRSMTARSGGSLEASPPTSSLSTPSRCAVYSREWSRSR